MSEMMNWDEIRRIAAHPLGSIGAHTVHHYNLRRLGMGEAEREIAASRDIIAIETGTAPRHFAYPYGHAHAVGEREVAWCAMPAMPRPSRPATACCRAEHRDHLHALPRISVNGRYQQIGYVRTMLSGLTTSPTAASGWLPCSASILAVGLGQHPLDHQHGRQDPQETGQEEIEHVHQRAGFGELRHRHAVATSA
jgi:hypothetical protein